jgi:hypothetical protein
VAPEQPVPPPGSPDNDAAIFQESQPIADVGEPTETPYNPARAREWVRGGIACTLVLLLVLLTLWPVLAIINDWATWKQLRELLTLTYATTAGLVGSAIGFYFGTRRDRP